MRKLIFALAIWSFQCKSENLGLLYNNLGAFDGEIRAYTTMRPGLFGRTERTAYLRRDEIALTDASGKSFRVHASFVSGTGSSLLRSAEATEEEAFQELSGTTFDSVSGDSIADTRADPLVLHPKASLEKGVDFANAYTMARIASNIYDKFPDAAQVFHNMGFTEQDYIDGIKSNAQGVILENDKFIVIAFRGTEFTVLQDWITDAKLFPVPLLKGVGGLKVHMGFYQSTTEMLPFVRERLVSTLENKLRRIVAKLTPLQMRDYGINGPVAKPDEREIFIGGHSLGGAIAQQIYGELVLHDLDHTGEGYYFVDPVLRAIPEEKLTALFSDTISNDIGAPRPNFSETMSEDFQFDQSFKYLGTFESEADYNGYQSSTSDRTDPVVDKRINSVITFGCPRNGNWLYKYALEKKAGGAGTQIYRFENLFKNAAFENDIFQGDLVARVPLANPEIPGLPSYSHLGFRVDFETRDLDPKGDPSVLKCEYTNRARERDLYALFSAKFSFGFHKMGLYLDRVQGYMHPAQPFAPNHSCRHETYIEKPEPITED